MKIKKLFLFLCFSTIVVCLSTLSAQNTRIAVISDLHYTHPSLIVEKGEALDAYLRKDRKLLLESHALLQKSVENILKEDVNLVLIPGDLTKDGEKVSHEAVAKLLKPLRDKGIEVLVVPGNHDINNPDAVCFIGSETKPVETIMPEDFAHIYADYGFKKALSRDTHSLSYLSEPIEGLQVLCLDANKYYDNTFLSKGAGQDSCVTNGFLKPETLRWATAMLSNAKSDGKHIVAMMHHNVVEHFQNQGYFAAPYLLDNYADVQQQFLQQGLNVVFTGHFHSSDIARAEDKNGNFLYEIETGSIVTYPCPYRLIDQVGNSLVLETKYIDSIDYDIPQAQPFPQYAESLIEKGFNEMIPSIISSYHHNIAKVVPRWASAFVKVPNSAKLSQMLLDNFSEEGLKMLLAHYRGNEWLVEQSEVNKQALLQSIDNFIADVANESSGIFAGITQRILHRLDVVKKAKATVSSIWSNTMLAENKSGHHRIIYADYPINDLQLTFYVNSKQPLPSINDVEVAVFSKLQPLLPGDDTTIPNNLNRFATIGSRRKNVSEL